MAFVPGGTGVASQFPDGFTGSPLSNIETITATKVLTVSDRRMQILTPSGALRVAQLPATAFIGENWTFTCNPSAAFSLEVRASGTSLIMTLAPGETLTITALTATPTANTDWAVQVPQTVLSNGTVSTPALRFTGSGSDTGIYSPATDQVAISTAGVQRFLISETGLATLSNGLSVTGTTTIPATINYTGAGSIVKSGAHAVTITSTATTNVTLPTSGTLATLAGTENLSNKTFTNATTFQAAVSTNASHLGGWGLVPVGFIGAYNPGFYTNNANAGFTVTGPAGNTIAQVNTFLNTQGWYVCDGSAPAAVGTVIWNAAGRHLPNLTDSRFLMGSTTAGAIGGDATTSIAHTHSVTSNVTVANHILVEANLPAHDHTINHDHTSFNTVSAGTHSHRSFAGVDTAGVTPGAANRYVWASGATLVTSGADVVGTDNSSHLHAIDVPNFTGLSGSSGSGTAVTHSVTNNAVTSGAASVTSVSILPTYLSTYFIIRVF